MFLLYHLIWVLEVHSLHAEESTIAFFNKWCIFIYFHNLSGADVSFSSPLTTVKESLMTFSETKCHRIKALELDVWCISPLKWEKLMLGFFLFRSLFLKHIQSWRRNIFTRWIHLYFFWNTDLQLDLPHLFSDSDSDKLLNFSSTVIWIPNGRTESRATV